MSQVTHQYKVYDQSDNYLGLLPSVVSNFSYRLGINTVGSQLTVDVAQSVSDTPMPIALGSLDSWLSGWSTRQRITVPRASVSETLGEFPVYIDMGHLGDDLWENAQSDLDDIRVTDAFGNELPFQIVDYDYANRTGEMHFRAELSHLAENVFYVYSGNGSASAYSASDTYGSDNVWAAFTAVYHFESNNNDATANSYDGSAVGSPTYPGGKLDDGIALNGTTQYMEFGGTTTALDTAMAGVTAYSISAWFKKDGTGNFTDGDAIIAINDSSGGDKLSIRGTTSNNYISVADNGTNEINGSVDVTDEEWHKFTYVRSGATGSLYVDGALIGTHAVDHTLSTGDQWSVGQEWDAAVASNFWDGNIDEVRVVQSSLTAAWVAAEYLNQDTPASFYTVGQHEYEDSDAAATLIRNGNSVKVYESNENHPNGKLMFQGQINRVSASFGTNGGGLIKLLCHSIGRDLDDYYTRGTTTDVVVAENTDTNDSYGTWYDAGEPFGRYGQTWTAPSSGTVSKVRLGLSTNATGGGTGTLYLHGGVAQANAGVTPLASKSVTLTNNQTSPVTFELDTPVNVNEGQVYFVTYEPPATALFADSGTWSGLESHDNASNTYTGGAAYGYNSSTNLYEPTSTDEDFVFTVFKTVDTTEVTYSSQDPTESILETVMDDYISDGGGVTYDDADIEPTGLSLTMKFNTNTIYEALNKVLDVCPNGFYYYVDVADGKLHFKEASIDADYTLIKGRHVESLNLDLSIENVINQVVFSGGDTGGGENLYKIYENAASQSSYGNRLARLSDNRVTVETTADAIGESRIAEFRDEQYFTTIQVLSSSMDITLFKPGDTIRLAGYGSWVDTLILQITGISYETHRVQLQVGMLPARFGSKVEETLRGLIAEQTVDNPSTPS